MLMFASSLLQSQSYLNPTPHCASTIQLLRAGSPGMSVLLPLEQSGNGSSDPLALEVSG